MQPDERLYDYVFAVQPKRPQWFPLPWLSPSFLFLVEICLPLHPYFDSQLEHSFVGPPTPNTLHQVKFQTEEQTVRQYGETTAT